MKTYAALALLSLTLAACSQTSAPTAELSAQSYAAQLSARSGQTVATLQAALDARADVDFTRLSTQALAPQVYLNVLPVAGSESIRAYVKSTFAAPVTCSVTWGDGSGSTSVASPTVSRIETKDHAYTTFGTYTITVTCLNGNTVVGTQSVTLQAGRRDATFNFESPVASSNSYQIVTEIKAQGYTLRNAGNFVPIWSSSQPTSSYNSDGTQSYDPVFLTTVVSDDGSAFSLQAFDYLNFQINQAGTTQVTGYKQDGSTVTATVNGTNPVQTATFGASWTQLIRLEFSSPQSARNFLDNISLSR